MRPETALAFRERVYRLTRFYVPDKALAFSGEPVAGRISKVYPHSTFNTGLTPRPVLALWQAHRGQGEKHATWYGLESSDDQFPSDQVEQIMRYYVKTANQRNHLREIREIRFPIMEEGALYER